MLEQTTLVEKLKEYVNNGLISERSDDKKFNIYNYTQKTTFDRLWDDITIMCRGLIVNVSTGEIVARGFNKFFNVNEDCQFEDLDWSNGYEVTDKMDGSLGIIFKTLDGNLAVATRGSFSSEQAIWATAFLQKNWNTKKLYNNIPEAGTVLCEIIYPENKIVIDYGSKEDLVLLSIINNSDGSDYDREYCEKFADNNGFNIVKSRKYSIDNMLELVKNEDKNTEGWVVKFKNGTRIKIKTDAYVSIARILSHATPLEFWRHMRMGRVNQEWLDSIPEEIFELRDSIKSSLELKYSEVLNEMLKEYKVLKSKNLATPKENANFMNMETKYKTFLFNLLKSDGNITDKIDNFIMKIIRPTGNDFGNLDRTYLCGLTNRGFDDSLD